MQKRATSVVCAAEIMHRVNEHAEPLRVGVLRNAVAEVENMPCAVAVTFQYGSHFRADALGCTEQH